jgi:hypothetical protein
MVRRPLFGYQRAATETGRPCAGRTLTISMLVSRISNPIFFANDLCIVGGSNFIALKDRPGPCRGDDWQLLASAGRRGERGPCGVQGERGPDGPRWRTPPPRPPKPPPPPPAA